MAGDTRYKENGWPHPPTAERKTSPHSNVLGARKREKTDQEDMSISWRGACTDGSRSLTRMQTH